MTDTNQKQLGNTLWSIANLARTSKCGATEHAASRLQIHRDGIL
jgi:hypothetical protein